MTTPTPPAEPTLASLNARDDLRVSHEDVDPRGWPLLVGAGGHAADVDDLIVDTDAGRVRYIACSLLAAHGHAPRRVLVPVGYARLDAETRTVIVDVIVEDDLPGLPAFTGLPVSADMEAALLAAFTRGGNEPK